MNEIRPAPHPAQLTKARFGRYVSARRQWASSRDRADRSACPHRPRVGQPVIGTVRRRGIKASLSTLPAVGTVGNLGGSRQYPFNREGIKAGAAEHRACNA